MGVNLAGVELILRLLEEMDDMGREFEKQFLEFATEAERRLAEALGTPTIPVRKGESLLPVPNMKFRRRVDL
jgi:MerR family transcriptional regulator/heat shock protein HspR